MYLIKCDKCECLKGRSDFYKKKNGKLLSKKCKVCYRGGVKKNREDDKEYYLEYDRLRQNNPDRVKARELCQNDKGKETCSRAKKNYTETKRRGVCI